MSSKSKRWLFIILWSCVVAIIIGDILALLDVKPMFASTYASALTYAFIPLVIVYIIQVWMTGHKNPFTLFKRGVL